jgi:hypothetical protein
MAIDASGEWWIGSEALDILEYLKAYKAEGYAVHETRMCKCACGSLIFRLEADRNEGCARRTCISCRTSHLICDSAEVWEEAEPETWQCTQCKSEACNLGVGFSLYGTQNDEVPDVRWISVGNRCASCGTLGSFVDWKIGYGPSYQLLKQT